MSWNPLIQLAVGYRNLYKEWWRFSGPVPLTNRVAHFSLRDTCVPGVSSSRVMTSAPSPVARPSARPVPRASALPRV